MSIKTEEKVISNTYTFVHLDNVECEMHELLDILKELNYRDIYVRKDLSKKLIELKVAKKSGMTHKQIRRGDKYEAFHKKITGIFKKSEIKRFNT